MLDSTAMLSVGTVCFQLWNNLMKRELTARISKDWQEIGFQGNNPATDFRGMGLLGLKCLQYPIQPVQVSVKPSIEVYTNEWT